MTLRQIPGSSLTRWSSDIVVSHNVVKVKEKSASLEQDQEQDQYWDQDQGGGIFLQRVCFE